MDFENDLEALDAAISEIDKRIKKLEKHKEFATKKLKYNKSQSTTMETLRRLEHNLSDLHKKHEFLIKEKNSKFS